MSLLNLNRIKTLLIIVILIAESILVKKHRNNKILKTQVSQRNLELQIHLVILNIHQMKMLKAKEFLRLIKIKI